MKLLNTHAPAAQAFTDACLNEMRWSKKRCEKDVELSTIVETLSKAAQQTSQAVIRPSAASVINSATYVRGPSPFTLARRMQITAS